MACRQEFTKDYDETKRKKRVEKRKNNNEAWYLNYFIYFKIMRAHLLKWHYFIYLYLKEKNIDYTDGQYLTTHLRDKDLELFL